MPQKKSFCQKKMFEFHAQVQKCRKIAKMALLNPSMIFKDVFGSNTSFEAL